MSNETDNGSFLSMACAMFTEVAVGKGTGLLAGITNDDDEPVIIVIGTTQKGKKFKRYYRPENSDKARRMNIRNLKFRDNEPVLDYDYTTAANPRYPARGMIVIKEAEVTEHASVKAE